MEKGRTFLKLNHVSFKAANIRKGSNKELPRRLFIKLVKHSSRSKLKKKKTKRRKRKEKSRTWRSQQAHPVYSTKMSKKTLRGSFSLFRKIQTSELPCPRKVFILIFFFIKHL